MDLVSGLSAVGSIASAFGGSGNSKYEFDESLGWDMQKTRQGIQMRVKDAKIAGIHPLYALGAPSMSSGIVSSGRGDSNKIAGAMQGLANALDRKYEKELRQKNLENIQADIDLKRAQATGFVAEAKKASNIARSTQTGRVAGNDIDFVNPQVTKKLPMGKGAEIIADPKVADSSSYEDRYGEWANLFAPYVMWRDFKYNHNKKYPNYKDVKKKYPVNTGSLFMNLFNYYNRYKKGK